jgi:hypothetical protein
LRQSRALWTRPAFAVLYFLAAAVVASALALSLWRRVEDRHRLATGSARWIWLTRELERPAPLSFLAVREFDWGGGPAGPAPVLLFVDRRHTFLVNGVRVGVGEQRPGDPLRAYEISRQLVRGRNLLLIEAQSPDGAGGILFSLRLDGQMVVSDASWRVARSEKDLARGGTGAVVWGRPPMYPWGYPARPAGN